jgi:hypothetical protein
LHLNIGALGLANQYCYGGTAVIETIAIDGELRRSAGDRRPGLDILNLERLLGLGGDGCPFAADRCGRPAGRKERHDHQGVEATDTHRILSHVGIGNRT